MAYKMFSQGLQNLALLMNLQNLALLMNCNLVQGDYTVAYMDNAVQEMKEQSAFDLKTVRHIELVYKNLRSLKRLRKVELKDLRKIIEDLQKEVQRELEKDGSKQREMPQDAQASRQDEEVNVESNGLYSLVSNLGETIPVCLVSAAFGWLFACYSASNR